MFPGAMALKSQGRDQGVVECLSRGDITYNQFATSYKAITYNQVATSYKATRLQDCRAHRDCKAVSYKATEAARLHVIFNMLLSLVAHKGPADWEASSSIYLNVLRISSWRPKG